MSLKDKKPIYEHKNSCLKFRIVVDDGCYMILIPDQNRKGEWVKTPWIFPEAFDVLKKLSTPRGALYDITRDGPMEMEDAFEFAMKEKDKRDKKEHLDN